VHVSVLIAALRRPRDTNQILASDETRLGRLVFLEVRPGVDEDVVLAIRAGISAECQYAAAARPILSYTGQSAECWLNPSFSGGEGRRSTPKQLNRVM